MLRIFTLSKSQVEILQQTENVRTYLHEAISLP